GRPPTRRVRLWIDKARPRAIVRRPYPRSPGTDQRPPALHSPARAHGCPIEASPDRAASAMPGKAGHRAVDRILTICRQFLACFGPCDRGNLCRGLGGRRRTPRIAWTIGLGHHGGPMVNERLTGQREVAD